MKTLIPLASLVLALATLNVSAERPLLVLGRESRDRSEHEVVDACGARVGPQSLEGRAVSREPIAALEPLSIEHVKLR